MGGCNLAKRSARGILVIVPGSEPGGGGGFDFWENWGIFWARTKENEFALMNRYFKCLVFCLLFVGAGRTAVCQTYIFAQLTGTPMNTSGWNLAGDAYV